MSSWTEEIQVRAADTDPLAREVRGWTEVTLQLDAHAQGETRLGFGRRRSVLEPGTVYRMTIAPRTRIEVETTSTDPVQIRAWFTEHTWIDDFLRVLCQIRAGGDRG